MNIPFWTKMNGICLSGCRSLLLSDLKRSSQRELLLSQLNFFPDRKGLGRKISVEQFLGPLKGVRKEGRLQEQSP